MDEVVINVFNIVGNSFCIEAGDGQKVFEMISKVLRDNKSVKISFQNVEMLTSAFLNVAVGQVYKDFSEDDIKKRVSVEQMAPDDMALLKRVTSTAKLYYKDPERMEKSINEIMGE
jgi:hypothetical protein